MFYRLYVLFILLLPIALFLAGCWCIIWVAKRFYPDCKERQKSIAILHGGMLIGVVALMAQVMYNLHLIDA